MRIKENPADITLENNRLIAFLLILLRIEAYIEAFLKCWGVVIIARAIRNVAINVHNHLLGSSIGLSGSWLCY